MEKIRKTVILSVLIIILATIAHVISNNYVGIVFAIIILVIMGMIIAEVSGVLVSEVSKILEKLFRRKSKN